MSRGGRRACSCDHPGRRGHGCRCRVTGAATALVETGADAALAFRGCRIGVARPPPLFLVSTAAASVVLDERWGRLPHVCWVCDGCGVRTCAARLPCLRGEAAVGAVPVNGGCRCMMVARRGRRLPLCDGGKAWAAAAAVVNITRWGPAPCSDRATPVRSHPACWNAGGKAGKVPARNPSVGHNQGVGHDQTAHQDAPAAASGPTPHQKQ